MLLGLLAGSGEEEDDLDGIAIEPDAVAGKPEDHFRAGEPFDANMGNGDFIAEVAVGIGVPSGERGAEFFHPVGKSRSAEKQLKDLGKFSRETGYNLPWPQQLDDHLSPLPAGMSQAARIRRARPPRWRSAETMATPRIQI